MIPNGAAKYQAVQITTASPGEVLLALFDGLFKFLNIARHSLRNNQRARAGETMSRAHAIISELYCSLDNKHAPELCDNLSGVYDFCLARISHATRHNSPEALDEIVKVLTPIREAFTTVVRQTPAQKLEARSATGT